MHKSLFNKIGIPRIIASLLVLVVIFLTIGFSAFQSELNISSKAIVRIDKDIRITSATVHSQANSATSSYTNYNVSVSSKPQFNITRTFKDIWPFDKLKSNFNISQ